MDKRGHGSLFRISDAMAENDLDYAKYCVFFCVEHILTRKKIALVCNVERERRNMISVYLIKLSNYCIDIYLLSMICIESGIIRSYILTYLIY